MLAWSRCAPLFALLLPTVAGCGPEPQPPPSEPVGGAQGQSSGNEATTTPAHGAAGIQQQRAKAELDAHMRANFLVAIDARDAVIDGDLVRAIEAFNWLATENFEGMLPEQWKPFSTQLQQSAQRGAQAQTLPDAAQRVAEVAQRCGDCHRNFTVGKDRGPEEEQGFAPVGPEHVETRMVRHQWAADELWHGLVIPSDLTWQGGAKILLDAPLQPPENADGSQAPQLAAEIDDLRALGKRALDASEDRARVEVYGQLLGRCSSCHMRQPR